MYPACEVLEEPGRIIIAGARLDWKCSLILHHLDPAAEPLEQTRPLGGQMLTNRIRERAHERLEAFGLLAVMREQRLPIWQRLPISWPSFEPRPHVSWNT